MAEIIVSGIEKSFVQDRVVLDDVSFQVDEGERVGLLGPNGAGKTTACTALSPFRAWF